MPGMTMKFRVAEPSLLNTVKEGEELGFTVEQQGSAFVITGFQALRPGVSDARAVVKSIDRAVRFIEENRKGPFFLYLCHWDVHGPHRARKAIIGKYREKLDKIDQGIQRALRDADL